MGWLRSLVARLRGGAERSAVLDSGSRPDAVGVAIATGSIESEREDELDGEEHAEDV